MGVHKSGAFILIGGAGERKDTGENETKETTQGRLARIVLSCTILRSSLGIFLRTQSFQFRTPSTGIMANLFCRCAKSVNCHIHRLGTRHLMDKLLLEEKSHRKSKRYSNIFCLSSRAVPKLPKKRKGEKSWDSFGG